MEDGTSFGCASPGFEFVNGEVDDLDIIGDVLSTLAPWLFKDSRTNVSSWGHIHHPHPSRQSRGCPLVRLRGASSVAWWRLLSQRSRYGGFAYGGGGRPRSRTKSHMKGRLSNRRRRRRRPASCRGSTGRSGQENVNIRGLFSSRPSTGLPSCPFRRGCLRRWTLRHGERRMRTSVLYIKSVILLKHRRLSSDRSDIVIVFRQCQKALSRDDPRAPSEARHQRYFGLSIRLLRGVSSGTVTTKL